jgi:hypothetical protein
VVLDVDVLRTRVVFRVGSNGDSRLVVGVDDGWSCLWVSYFGEEQTEPYGFLEGVTLTDIFGFVG